MTISDYTNWARNTDDKMVNIQKVVLILGGQLQKHKCMGDDTVFFGFSPI